ncbi:MAG: adenylate/guanylate cyclase domain-containing protein [Spirochaeta sp.]|jgi:adenylate cyclase|nr:adenylate/guanylate cyclase domain-containing protein [Spirochaeta sp.]
MSRELRNQIEDFYLPRQLVDAIIEVGGIPRESEEVEVGVGFIDIANYTFLSKFLTPKENQEVLNGLYTAFNSVLRRHGGYLNKIEGDSLMFHYGGLIDSKVRTLTDPLQIRRYISRQLFHTCVEMQRVSVHFNNADSRFLDDVASAIDRDALERAFAIMQRLRNDDAVSSSLSAMFQIRIRIGANLGEVTIGNFGPEGARQWDVIGMPVIDAKRMETTAPVGGLRVSRQYFELLDEQGIADEYYERFRREAHALGGRYRNITKAELFAVRPVVIKEKGGAVYETCSIQVNPGLPEQIARQTQALLMQQHYGAEHIVQLLQYYRGNRYVVDAIEEALVDAGVIIRRLDMYELMYPNRAEHLVAKTGSRGAAEHYLAGNFKLFDLMTKLGKYQDLVNRSVGEDRGPLPFSSYEQYVEHGSAQYADFYERKKQEIAQRSYFHIVVFPMVFHSLHACILEYQYSQEDLELLSG